MSRATIRATTTTDTIAIAASRLEMGVSSSMLDNRAVKSDGRVGRV